MFGFESLLGIDPSQGKPTLRPKNTIDTDLIQAYLTKEDDKAQEWVIETVKQVSTCMTEKVGQVGLQMATLTRNNFAGDGLDHVRARASVLWFLRHVGYRVHMEPVSHGVVIVIAWWNDPPYEAKEPATPETPLPSVGPNL